MSRTNGLKGRRKPKTTSTTSKTTTAVSLLLLAAFAVLGGTLSFTPSPMITSASRGNRKTCPPLSLALKRMEGESEKAFFQRVTTAASDPAAFERMVASDAAAGEPSTYATRTTNGSTNGKKNGAASTAGHAGNGAGNPNKQPTAGYVRAEDWEAEQEEKRKNGSLSWEERVQFEGQRSGDRFKQNEILRHNLNAW